MVWDKEVERVFNSAAKELNMVLTKTRGGFMLSDNINSFGFVTFVDRNGIMKITMSSSRTSRPISLGDYSEDAIKTQEPIRAIVTAVLENKN